MKYNGVVRIHTNVGRSGDGNATSWCFCVEVLLHASVLDDTLHRIVCVGGNFLSEWNAGGFHVWLL